MISTHHKKVFVNNKGQALSEVVVAVPIVLLLIFAIHEFGRVYYVYTILNGAAHEAARLATLPDNARRINPVTGMSPLEPVNVDYIRRTIVERARQAGLFEDYSQRYCDGYIYTDFFGNRRCMGIWRTCRAPKDTQILMSNGYPPALPPNNYTPAGPGDPNFDPLDPNPPTPRTCNRLTGNINLSAGRCNVPQLLTTICGEDGTQQFQRSTVTIQYNWGETFPIINTIGRIFGPDTLDNIMPSVSVTMRNQYED